MSKRANLLFLFFGFVCFSSLDGSAWAATYDLKEITPVVQGAINGRQSRYQEIQRLKTSGVLGEDNQGFVKVLKPSPDADSLASGENADRQAIYQAMVDQNQLGPDGMAQVRSVFAEVQRGKAQPGEFVQLRSGEWVQK